MSQNRVEDNMLTSYHSQHSTLNAEQNAVWFELSRNNSSYHHLARIQILMWHWLKAFATRTLRYCSGLKRMHRNIDSRPGLILVWSMFETSLTLGRLVLFWFIPGLIAINSFTILSKDVSPVSCWFHSIFVIGLPAKSQRNYSQLVRDSQTPKSKRGWYTRLALILVQSWFSPWSMQLGFPCRSCSLFYSALSWSSLYQSFGLI